VAAPGHRWPKCALLSYLNGLGVVSCHRHQISPIGPADNIAPHLPHPPEVSRSSTWSVKLRVAIWGADMVRPSRRARLWVLTKYIGGDGVGVVNSGGERGFGADGPDSSWAAGAVGAEGVVSPLGGR
jgi:hypothetical protein